MNYVKSMNGRKVNWNGLGLGALGRVSGEQLKCVLCVGQARLVGGGECKNLRTDAVGHCKCLSRRSQTVMEIVGDLH